LQTRMVTDGRRVRPFSLRDATGRGDILTEEVIYWIWIAEDTDDFDGEMIVSNHYIEQFDLCLYLN